jgi:hypothetical protein
LIYRFREGDYLLGVVQFLDQALRSFDGFANADDLIQDFVFVVLDHAPVVGESPNTKPLVLALAAFKEVLTVRAKEAKELLRDRNAKRGVLPELVRGPDPLFLT